jgi:preprotein translocase subunit YajC
MPIALVYLVLLVLAFFLLVVQPQRRQLARHRALVASLEVGDEIITTGGIHGIIRSIDDAVLDVEIADGVVIRLARGAVGSRVNPPPGNDVVAEDSESRRDTSGGAG